MIIGFQNISVAVIYIVFPFLDAFCMLLAAKKICVSAIRTFDYPNQAQSQLIRIIKVLL